jgi:hypothetical protein
MVVVVVVVHTYSFTDVTLCPRLGSLGFSSSTQPKV